MARGSLGSLALAVASLRVVSAQIIGDEGPSQLNVLFMVESISIYVVVLGIFFFWNRILGLVVGFCLRQYLWKTADAHISIGSLQISPLAGRILFKDVRYHSTNMSARVLLGHITWRYWKWRIRKEDSNETAPCRCQIHLEGLEWFLYNRTPSFDAIVERMQDAEKRERNTEPSAKDASLDESSVGHSETGEAQGENETTETSGRRSTERSEPVESDAEPLHRPLSPPIPNIVGNMAGNVRDANDNKNEKLPWQWQRDVFPFGIDISHGAVVVGNDATPTVTIAEFSTAEGVVRTEESRSRFDLFKQVVDMKFTDIQVLYRTNPDFTGALLDHGKKAYEEVMKMEPELANAPPSTLITRPAFKALAKKYRSLASQYSTKLPSYALSYYGPEKEWKGLARYRDDTDIAAALKGKEMEYAKVTTLMSTRKIEMTYFADVAGLVPEPWERADEDGNIPEDDDFDLGNGDLPPQWGMDFVVYSGTMTYGPWADRQRTAFNQAFLPAIFYHTPQTERLRPGDFRKHVAMNIEVEIREATVWRMPTRESSKDWLYDKPNLPTKSADATRKYGWLDVSIGPSSAVHYTVPLTATKFGFEAELQLELANIKVTSSVNHTEFLSARHCLVNASMPTPLQWDARRDWTFDVNLDQVRTFLLRDHTTLIGDLAKDWNSGPTGDFDHFVPMDFQFNFCLTNFEIKLYLNDFNIINQPLALDENAFLNICGPKIEGQVEVPLIRYRPESSTIPFSINGEDMIFTMDLPRWQTHNQNSFGNDRLHNLGKVQDLHLRGSYLYFSEVHPDHVEALTLSIDLKKINFRAFGWAIRRLMILKENYFGGFNSWTNMAEFRKKYEATIPSWGDAVERKYRPGRSDKFEVNLDLRCVDGKVLLPEDIYDCDGAIILPIPYLQVYLRSHESFMQVCIDVGPTRAWYTPHSDFDFAEIGEDRRLQEHALHLNGISIRGNRLFGNPPLNSTYLCLWDIALDDVTGSLDVTLVKGMMRAMQTFKYNYNDMENAPLWLYAPPVDPDATLLKLSVESLSFSFSVQEYTCQVGVAQISLATNDLASSEYAKLLFLSVPSLVMRMQRYTNTQHDHPEASHRIAYLKAALFVDRHAAPAGWKQRRMKQQRFIRAQDARSRRCGPIYGEAAPTEPFYNGVLYCPSPFDSALSAEGYLPDDTNSTDWSTDDDDCSSAEDDADTWRGPALRKWRSAKSALRAPRKLFMDELSGTTPRSFSDSTQNAASSRSDQEDYALITISTGPMVEAEATPAILGAVAAYQAVFKNEDLTFSQILDDLSVDQAGRIKSARDTELRSTDQFLVQVPALRLRLQQSCPPSARTGIATSIASDTAVDLRLETLRIRAYKIGQATLTGRHSPIQLLNARLGILTVRGEQDLTKTSVHLGNSEGFRRPQADLDDNLRFDFRISDIELETSTPLEGDGRNSVSVGNVGMHTGSLGPALLCVIAMSWRGNIFAFTRISDPLPRPAIAQLAISQIVEGIRTVQDPTCLTSRFELLRHKDIAYIAASSPTNVHVAAREDPGWLALTLLRVLMKKRDLTHHKISTNSTAKPHLEAILDDNIRTISSWRKQNLSKESVAGLAYMALPNRIASPASSPGSGVSRLDSVFVTELHIQMDDQRQGTEVELFVLNIQKLTASHVENAEQDLRHPGGKAIHSEMETCKIRSHVYLLDRLQDLAPTLLFTKKAVQGEIVSTISTHSLLPEVTNDRTPQLYIAALQIKEMGFSVLATPLRVDVKVLDLQCMVSKTTFRVSATPDIANLNTTKTRVRLISLTSKQENPSPQVALVVLELNKTRLSLCDVNQKNHAAPPRASIIVNAHHVLVHTRATPHVMHARIQEWLDSYKSKYMNTLEGLSDLFKEQAGRTPDQDKSSGGSSIKNMPVGRIAIVADGCAFNVRISKEVTAFWTVDKSEVRLLAADLAKREGFHLQSSLTLGEQAIGFSKTSLAISNVSDAPSVDDVLLKVPVISLKADAEFSRRLIRIQGDLCIHHFTGTLKPKTFDRVLAMYRTIGSDIKAIGRLLAKTRGPPLKSTNELDREKALRKHQQRFIIDLTYEIKGVHLSLKAADVVSTLLIQSGRVYGKFARDTDITGETWSAHLDCLELSLGHAQEPLSDMSSQSHRAIQSAHLLCSFAIEQKPRIENTTKHGKRPTAIVDTTIQRVHAVMHVSALEEMYDLLNSWSRDLKTLAERRKREWEEIKESTRELIRADVKTGEAEAIGWMESAILTVVVSSFAVAIPLHAESVLNKRRHSSLPAALLFTIRRLDLVNRKGESGRTGIQDMYLQYVDSFDSHDDHHYDGQFHLSNNRMHLPEAQLQFRLETLADHRSCKVSSIFKGFELRLDRHVGRYVRETLVVYSRGKEQIGQLYRAYAVEPEAGSPDPQKVNDSRPRGRLLAVQTSAEFVSGKVLLIKGADNHPSRRSTYASASDVQEQLKAGTLAESISLPGVSLWIDFAEGTDLSPGTCRISTIIQKSENILKPSILQFVESATEPISTIAVASQHTETSNTLQSGEEEETDVRGSEATQEIVVPTVNQAVPPALAGFTAKTRLIFSLRIDKSRLTLSCEPDNQVVANLAWDSGGFNLQCKPKAESITATMQVSSVSFHLCREIYQVRHTFVSGALADLTATFVLREGSALPILQAMIYTKVSADLNIKLLRQWFAFNSVWIARLSPMARAIPPEDSAFGKLPARPACAPGPGQSSQFRRAGPLGKIGRHVVVGLRLHKVSLRANLDVSKVEIEIPLIDGRLAANDTLQRLLVDLGGLKMIGTHTVSGRVINEGIRFVAERKRVLDDAAYVTVMKLRIDAQDSLAELACIDQHVLGLHIYPTIVELYDDCLIGLEKGPSAVRKMGLAFKINLGQVDMMFAMLSLNALLDEFHTFLRRIDDEKTEAEHGSAAYRHHLANKPKNAIAAVAETMQKSRLTEMPVGATDLRIEQRLVLVTQRANLAIQATNEEKIYVFRLTPVHAKYRKTGHARHLEAEVESVRLSRDRPKDTTMLKDMKSVGKWLHNKTSVTREELVSLPFITIIMDSVENEISQLLDYDFDINYHNQKIKIALTMQAIRDAQEAYSIAKQIRAGKMDRDASAEVNGEGARSNLIMRPRKVNLKPPPADYLGSTTDEMLRLLKYDQAFQQAPHASHLVQTKLDMIMDLLLTIYNKLECNLP